MTTVQKSQVREQHACPWTEEGVKWCRVHTMKYFTEMQAGTSAVAQRTLLDMIWSKWNVAQKNTCYMIPFTSSSKARKTKGSWEVSEWCLAVGGPWFRDISGRDGQGVLGRGTLGLAGKVHKPLQWPRVRSVWMEVRTVLWIKHHRAAVLNGKVHIKHLRCLSRDTIKTCQLLLLSLLLLYWWELWKWKGNANYKLALAIYLYKD